MGGLSSIKYEALQSTEPVHPDASYMYEIFHNWHLYEIFHNWHFNVLIEIWMQLLKYEDIYKNMDAIIEIWL